MCSEPGSIDEPIPRRPEDARRVLRVRRHSLSTASIERQTQTESAGIHVNDRRPQPVDVDSWPGSLVKNFRESHEVAPRMPTHPRDGLWPRPMSPHLLTVAARLSRSVGRSGVLRPSVTLLTDPTFTAIGNWRGFDRDMSDIIGCDR